MCRVKFIWLRIFLFLGAVAAPLFLPKSSVPISPAARKAVVVELFTSEGCSDCPPADDLLGRLPRDPDLQPGVEIIPLGFHVDYWNFQGWTDRFSSVDYSRRQQNYAEKFRIDGPYTPQMVVDGSAQFVGSNARGAHQAIAQAALHPQEADVQISPLAGDKVLVRVKAAEGTSGDVLLAITEDNLMSKVRSGENGGRELHHAAVVRELHTLSSLRNGSFETTVPLKLQKDWKREDLRIVVFVQEPRNGKIEGAAAITAASLSSAR